MKIKDFRKQNNQNHKLDLPNLELEILISHVTKKDRSFVISHPEYKLLDREINKLWEYINRRKNNEPISYILGYKNFFGYDFLVNSSTLIPRPETEMLVNMVIDEITKSSKKHITILEVGTGTGCIPISILNEAQKINLPKNISIKALDISNEALKVAISNAKTYQKSNNIDFKLINILDTEQVRDKLQNKFDIIISNPPYIPTKEIKNLESDIKDFEPLLALDGGDTGMVYYDAILKNTFNCLSKHSVLIFEIHHKLAKKFDSIVRKYLESFEIEISKDYFGKNRYIKVISPIRPRK